MIFKNKLTIVILALFLVASYIFILPTARKPRSQFHSSQLEKTVSAYGNAERTDYVDSDGRITIAADLGYATVIVTTVSNNSKLEQYYDDHGDPISRYNGYYGVLQDYDEKSNSIRITYLNCDGEPMIMANGYAIEERKYNDRQQEISVRYFDTEGEPILTPLYGHGVNKEYNEKRKSSRITYIDTSGAPTMTGLGYASVIRNYYASDGPENDKVESEFYFDEAGNPVCLALGQYGVHKEYDEYGRQAILTYLDAFGEPIRTNKGYTTIIRTFYANNRIATERYLDLDGNPFSLSEGQYGVKNYGDQTVYLDQNGNESFNIKNLLYNHPRIVIPLALSVVILSAFAGKKQNVILLIFCIMAIAYMTLLFRDSESAGYSGLLRYYRRILFDSGARADIIKNIWLFIPFGAVLYRLHPKTAILLVPIVLSALIEGIQFSARIGTCELDDVISNGLGGWIGFCMGRLATDIKLSISNRKQHPA